MSNIVNGNGTINGKAAIRSLEGDLAHARERIAGLGNAPAVTHWRRRAQALEWAIQVCRLYVDGGRLKRLSETDSEGS